MTTSDDLKPIFEGCLSILDEHESKYHDCWKHLSTTELLAIIKLKLTRLESDMNIDDKLRNDAPDAINYLAMYIWKLMNQK